MERSEIPHDPRHLGVPPGASKTIFEPMVRLTQTVHLSYIKISTIPKQAELSLETRHLGLPSGASKTISKPMARLAQTVHLSCADTNTVSDEDITCSDITTLATFDSQVKQFFIMIVFDTFDELMLHHDVCSFSFSELLTWIKGRFDCIWKAWKVNEVDWGPNPSIPNVLR